eukprot:7163035-Ditylum_brightwellii.AAC.1
MGRDAPFSRPKKNHSCTDLPPRIFHPINKAATTATSKSTTTEDNNKCNNQSRVTSPEKRHNCRSNKNCQNHHNCQTHNNHHNP